MSDPLYQDRRRFERGVLVFDDGESTIRCGGTADKPWFVAKDVCDVLGIANARDALGRLDDDEKGDVGIADAIGRKQRTAIVYESGLYALIFTSRKDEARGIPEVGHVGSSSVDPKDRKLSP